jgi:hypothetical protein
MHSEHCSFLPLKINFQMILAKRFILTLILLAPGLSVCAYAGDSQGVSSFNGEYIRYINGKEDTDSSSIDIKSVGSTKLKIIGTALWVGNVDTGDVHDGEISGTYRIQNNRVRYSDKSGCTLNITFGDNSLTVSDTHAFKCGGMSVTFDGFYRRVKKTYTETLCTTDEEPLFSCKVKTKTLSICASSDLSPTEGYLKYRFGLSQQQIELTYPDGTPHPDQYFRFYRDTEAKASTQQLSFTIGSSSYTVFVERSTIDFNGSGVFIKSNGKQTAYLSCNQESPSSDKLDWLDGLGLEPADYEKFDSSYPQ